MEEKDFEARFEHRFDQLDAKIDDEISSLREELKKEIWERFLATTRDTSILWLSLKPTSSETRRRVFDEIQNVTDEHFKLLAETSVDEFQKRVFNFKKEVNRITRAAGLGEIWLFPKD